jgi:sarcosine oxidase
MPYLALMADIETYDIVVIGLGAHGSSTLWHLSRTGAKIAGIDRFHPPHRRGSSHGESRIIRQAYHENPLYVPLVRAAYPIWQELSEIAGRPLYKKTGGLFLGKKDSTVVSGARLSAKTHNIPYDYLDATAIRNRFPAFRPGDDTVGVLEHEAGILFPEAAIDTFLQIAAAGGAQVKTDEQVVRIDSSKEAIELTTTKGKYRTAKLIVTAGAWLDTLFPGLNLPLSVRRQPLFWFRDRAKSSEAVPIFLWEYEKGQMFYGIPDLGHGLKLGWHHGGRRINPDELSQNVEKQEITAMRQTANQYLTIDPVFQKSCVCMYTNTPDEDFIIDLHPDHPNIVIASPCSGHGFKFSAIIGRLLTDLALDQPTGFDLTPFSIRRKDLHLR